jgi:hypothetical protein
MHKWLKYLGYVALITIPAWRLAQIIKYGVFPGTSPKTPTVPVTPRQTLYMNGRNLNDVGGRKITLRGVNLQLLDDWSFPATDKLSEVEKTGANAVRIQWYKDYPRSQTGSQRPAYSSIDLDSFLVKCRNSRIIPIVGFGILHAITTQVC